MIIGFTGKKQSGKSTAAKYVAEEYGAVRINFKDGLVAEIKEKFPDLLQAILSTMDKVDYDGLNPWTIERLFADKPPLVRTLMQNYGTEVRRSDNPTHWIQEWIIGVVEAEGRGVVTDDVRFLNEAEAVRQMGGIVIRIERGDMESSDNHLSETEMDLVVPDHIIKVNTGDFSSLYSQLDELLEAKPHEDE